MICQYVCQWILFVLYMKITTCLLVLLNQSRANACELVSSLSAYERSLVYLEHNFHSYMIAMVIGNLPFGTLETEAWIEE